METHSSTPLTSPRCLSSCVCCICDFSPMYCLRCLRPPAVAVVVVIQIRVARQALLLPLPHCDPRLVSFDFHPIFPRRRGMEKKASLFLKKTVTMSVGPTGLRYSPRSIPLFSYYYKYICIEQNAMRCFASHFLRFYQPSTVGKYHTTSPP